MAKIFVVVEKLKDWKPYYPIDQLLTPMDYLIKWEELYQASTSATERVKVINLCRNYKYLSNGYYCSLLAEARGHSVIPSIKTISELSKSFLYHLETNDLDTAVQKALKSKESTESFSINIFFGQTLYFPLEDVARQIFDLFQTPLLQVEFCHDGKWEIDSIKPIALNSLTPEEEDLFASALDSYSNKIWKKPRSKKQYRYDLAILHNPKEELAPSNKKALQNFIKVGKDLNVCVELIEKKDYSSLAEYDALFIRETTSINHHTYRFAKKAQSEGMVVIDDPMSMLRCTNKIYLANLMKEHNISGPKTIIVSKEQFENAKEKMDLIPGLDFPVIMKIPDGSFSKGVVKAKTLEDFNHYAEEYFKKTSLILIQEFVYTDFDWRIGILNDRPIFAAKYFMSKGHWQIYNHKGTNNKMDVGDGEAVPVHKVPKAILNTALKAAHLIGDGLYGVDIKEKDGKPYLIEINDNPNIDAGVEDSILGTDLYQMIIMDFIRRIEDKR
jgi:glutathione synthase/RimK-type ligase-like ATP-grasp enzyme